MSANNRAEARAKLVAGGEAPRCPVSGHWLTFDTDRQGRALQHCVCGYECYVPLRSGSLPTQGPLPGPVALVPIPSLPTLWQRAKGIAAMARKPGTTRKK